MPDEETTPAPETGAPETLPVETTATEPEQTEEPFDKDRAMATITKLREFEKLAKKLEKENKTFKEAEEKRQREQMTEMERLQADNAKLMAQLEEAQHIELQRQAAAEAGLPAELALRLRGESLDDLKADAEMLLAVIPKGEKPKVTHPTNPSLTQGLKETDEQRRRRLGLA